MGDEMRLDYADWLTPDRLQIEERLWKRDRRFVRYAIAVIYLIEEYGAKYVEEYGCGTGWVPTELQGVEYIGYDRNAGCLNLARLKNFDRPYVMFENAEIRTQIPQHNDLVCAFAVLKHFPLEQMVNLFQHLFGKANTVAFSIPIAVTAHEDGTEFTHTWLSEEYVSSLLQQCGLKEVARDASLPEEPIIMAVRR